MTSITDIIRKEIENLSTDATRTNVGVITTLADGVARVSGLSKVMFNEMVEFPNNVLGIALNLEEDYVGCVLLGDTSSLKEGDEARTTGKLLSVPVGKELLGRVVDGVGRPIDERGPINSDQSYPVERIAPGIIPRKSVDQPLQTGIMAVDSMVPIGRGQRELIIGDRSTGKTTIAIDTIINQAKINQQGEESGNPDFRPVFCIYVAVGQKNSNIARTIKVFEEKNALQYVTIISAPAADNPANQYIAPYSGCAMGEWFMENGMDALIVYDDLSKHAVAYRQISLILKRPSGREAYPGDVFYLHSRLLERSARLNEKSGNGSLTALPIIETQMGDVSGYIPTNVISITDGQIFLETDLFNKGIRPAVSVGLSVSRVGSAAQIKAYKKVAGKVKLELAQFRELAAFSQFESDLDASTKARLDRGARIVEMFKQTANDPMPVEIQTALMWAMQNNFFDSIEVTQINSAVLSLREHMATQGKEACDLIYASGKLDEETEQALKLIIEDWKRSFSISST